MIELAKPNVNDLQTAVDALRLWQVEGATMQLHPGDIGWFWRFGTQATADALRIWYQDGQPRAIGLLDSPTLLRLAIAPEMLGDDALAHQLVADLSQPERGLLPAGKVGIAAPPNAHVTSLLLEHNWKMGEPWTPLRHSLTALPPMPRVRIELVGPDLIHQRVAVQRASFERSSFTAERWHEMSLGPLYADARCLVALNDEDAAVAAVTIWSAGEGKPGLIEPMGVHRDHRGLGYGKAITVAAVSALKQIGSSSAIVSTPSSNLGAIATYRSAGFDPLPEICDLIRQT